MILDRSMTRGQAIKLARDLRLRIADVLASPLVLLSALLMREIRYRGVSRLPVSKAILLKVGVFPIRDHYYEPMFHPRHLRKPLTDERQLQGIDWNVSEQLEILRQFDFNAELEQFPLDQSAAGGFHYRNGYFQVGDAEYLYNMIRRRRPRRIVEIGSGYSTLIAAEAVRRNKQEDAAYDCEHICVEPYENSWLRELGVTVVREVVERVDRSIFSGLRKNDILFIDSSHVIRPQGDVIHEYLEILPTLAPGVLVHVHDIFSPRDYPSRVIADWVLLWNEQYLVEAFLSFNRQFRVIGALNFLLLKYPEELAARCPLLARAMAGNELEGMEPRSFWLTKT